MARNVDRATIRERVRWRSDTENATRRFPDTELNDAINEGIAQFHAEMVRARGQGFSEATTSVTTVTGVQEYALPATFLEVVKVWTLINGFEHVLRTYEEFDTEGLCEPVDWDSILDMSYRLVGDNISFRPTPNNAKVVNIKYIATAVRLDDDADTLDGVDGFEEFVVAWAGIRVATKNRDWELKQALSDDAQAILGRIHALQPARNAAEPPRMQDVKQSRLYWGRWNRRFPPA